MIGAVLLFGGAGGRGGCRPHAYGAVGEGDPRRPKVEPNSSLAEALGSRRATPVQEKIVL
jgi:hypothetical protein